jgi:hypothetical protein
MADTVTGVKYLSYYASRLLVKKLKQIIGLFLNNI